MKLNIDLDWTTLIPTERYGDWSFVDDPEHWLHFEPMPDAIETLEYLYEAGHVITFVTARPPHPNTMKWLRGHLPTRGIELVEGEGRKWNVPADLWLDDSPLVVEGLWARGLCAVKFAGDHNDSTPCAYEVDNWKQFAALIDSEPDVHQQKHKRVDPYRYKRAARGDRAA